MHAGNNDVGRFRTEFSNEGRARSADLGGQTSFTAELGDKCHDLRVLSRSSPVATMLGGAVHNSGADRAGCSAHFGRSLNGSCFSHSLHQLREQRIGTDHALLKFHRDDRGCRRINQRAQPLKPWVL